MIRKIISAFLLLSIVQAALSQKYDWPMWRYDHNRSASTPEQLADKLYLQWQVQYSPRVPVWDDPLNQNLMQYDRIFEPIVAGNKIFLGFNDQDKIIALDINTGNELWHYYADGPVRLPLASNNGKIYFTGDDGFCYCLNAETGSLVWKILLAPAPNKLLGNKRLISMWPARGGIVIKDNIIYTAASIFPLMGTFIYAINAEDGKIIWKNEGTSSNYILQPHRSPAFADVAPQGSFVITGDRLLVAGGRSVPAGFDINTGTELFYQLAASGKTGGAFSCSNDRVYFNHHRERMTYMYDSKNGNKLISNAGEYPVVEGNTIYFSGKKISAASISSANQLNKLWTIDASATNDLIKAGNILYAADSTGINAVRIEENKQPELLWRIASEKNIERLVASNGKLIAVSDDGTIRVFGDKPVTNIAYNLKPAQYIKGNSCKTKKIMRSAGISEGYALVFGTNDVNLLKALISKTYLSVIAYEKNSERVNYMREFFDDAGVKSDRLSFLKYDDTFPLLPKYFSSLTIVNDDFFLNGYDNELLKMIYESARPYDGKIFIRVKGEEQKNLINAFNDLKLYGASVAPGKGFAVITRTGSLEGSDSWTHNYGDIANTVKSDDKMVKAPLGILWFGGNSNLDVLPRHGHGPGEQVIDGRLIIQGIGSISARDVYTGRVLWKRDSETLKDDNWLVYYDESYDENSPLDPKYNQEHLPGSNARGTNFIATKEYVYLIEGDKCQVIDIKTGDNVKTITTGDGKTKKLGYIGVYEDLLILGNNFSDFPGVEKDSATLDEPKFASYDLTASSEIIVLDRFSGKKLWSIPSNHGFIHNSVIAGDGILFCLDKLPQYYETKLRRRGEALHEGSRLLYLDIRTGNKINEETLDIFGTWLGYSSEHKLLLQANAPSGDMLNGEEGRRMNTYNTITKEKIWDKDISYRNPPIIHNDKIYLNGNGFSLLTGEPLLEKDPITGETLKWTFKREYGCGIVAASEHLLTFRSASAGFVNLDAFEGTGSLGGWKASCSTNLIVADGVLNSPDYTRTCQCPYQNQTSLALIYMPWMTYWTNSNYKWSGKQIKQLGLNLNAPGDRTSDKNTLWIEFPNVAGASPEIPVKIDTANYFLIRKDPISVSSESTPWISSSAIGGLRSMEITLSAEDETPEALYRINLYFSELENKQPGERVINIKIQDETVMENFDIAAETGKSDKEIIKSFSGIKAGKVLSIDLVPVKGNSIISGIELVQESLTIK
ncbi:MAG: PQQ-binding-like beta-propeller repeat protein [Bacteroidales bacterium]|jgi:outer membrane protein assembly factor BamB|nr:PQQ-binding-like beta-propeller repeat protein [Bacteroidales bacterium]